MADMIPSLMVDFLFPQPLNFFLIGNVLYLSSTSMSLPSSSIKSHRLSPLLFECQMC